MLLRSDQPLIFPESYRYRREKGWACVQKEFQTYGTPPADPVPWKYLQAPESQSRLRPRKYAEGQSERTHSLSPSHANRPPDRKLPDGVDRHWPAGRQHKQERRLVLSCRSPI